MAESHSAHVDEDLFSDLLNLEDKYYAEGHAAGVADGSRAGRIEGRTFGLEKGFEKFVELGRLGGRAEVWDARLRQASTTTQGGDGDGDGKEGDGDGGDGVKVPPLKGSERLKRQVERLQELTGPESLSTVNDEESVNAFDDRLREAKAKATLISKMAGERDLDAEPTSPPRGSGEPKMKGKGNGKEMEDFAGLPVGKRKE